MFGSGDSYKNNAKNLGGNSKTARVLGRHQVEMAWYLCWGTDEGMSCRWGDGRGKPDEENDFISSSENMFELDVTLLRCCGVKCRRRAESGFCPPSDSCLRFFQLSQTRKVFTECQDCCSPRGKMQEADWKMMAKMVFQPLIVAWLMPVCAVTTLGLCTFKSM